MRTAVLFSMIREGMIPCHCYFDGPGHLHGHQARLHGRADPRDNEYAEDAASPGRLSSSYFAQKRQKSSSPFFRAWSNSRECTIAAQS